MVVPVGVGMGVGVGVGVGVGAGVGVGLGVGVGAGVVDEAEIDVEEDGAELPQPTEIAMTAANRAVPTARTQAFMDFSR
jgi:hypothetical protein